jgi:hypothetical protein
MHLHITHRFMTFCIIYQLGVEVVRDRPVRLPNSADL